MLFRKALSAPTKALVGVALCFSATAYSTAATAAVCQPGDPNCVLPVGDPPPPVARTSDVPPPIVEERGGMGWLLPLLAALAALGVLLFVLDGDDDPVSP